MAVINIAKIELINSTENWLLNIFSARIFLAIELFFIYAILIWSRSRGLDVIWTNMLYIIRSNVNEEEL